MLYFTAGEGTLWLAPPGPWVGDGPAEADRPGRTPEELELDASRRARGAMRRWARHNRLDHLGTLTNADVVLDYGEMSRRVDGFFRRMREDGFRIPVAVVIEPHPGGHGWHAHFGAPRFISVRRLRAWWPHGRIDIQGPRDCPAGARGPRKLSRYLAKYIGKAIAGEELHGCSPRPAGAHRWWHTQGFEPPPVRVRFNRLAEAMDFLRRSYGEPDLMKAFGEGESYRPEGYWLSFPDELLREPPAWLLHPGWAGGRDPPRR